MSNAEWILGDNYSFILSTAQGIPAPFLNGANIGGSRFFPLAGLDFNILTLFPGGNTTFAHYLYVSITFLAAVSAIYSSYLKETVAPALLCFSLSSLLLFRKDMCKCEKMAHYAIVANFILFITLWFCFGMAGMTGGEKYHLDEKLPFLKLLKIVLWQWKIYLVILSMSVFRIFSIAFFQEQACLSV